MISAITSSATLRVLLNGALNTGTPRWPAASRSTWFVPMQKAPSASSRRASARTRAVTRVLLRMPRTCTSRIFSTSSSSARAPGDVSTRKPSCRKISSALGWTFSSRRTWIWLLGNEVSGGAAAVVMVSGRP